MPVVNLEAVPGGLPAISRFSSYNLLFFKSDFFFK
jgi:hypothetical protein